MCDAILSTRGVWLCRGIGRKRPVAALVAVPPKTDDIIQLCVSYKTADDIKI